MPGVSIGLQEGFGQLWTQRGQRAQGWQLKETAIHQTCLASNEPGRPDGSIGALVDITGVGALRVQDKVLVH